MPAVQAKIATLMSQRRVAEAIHKFCFDPKYHGQHSRDCVVECGVEK